MTEPQITVEKLHSVKDKDWHVRQMSRKDNLKTCEEDF